MKLDVGTQIVDFSLAFESKSFRLSNGKFANDNLTFSCCRGKQKSFIEREEILSGDTFEVKEKIEEKYPKVIFQIL